MQPHLMNAPRTVLFLSTLLASAGFCLVAGAQEAPRGAPPPDAKALVEAPKEGAVEPKYERPVDGTTASLAAGGLLTSGNSRLFAVTANGAVETRTDNNGFGAALLANYGESGPAGSRVQVSTENIQGRLRYDRYVAEHASFFLIGTGRHDRFQGLDFRLNLDPGFKYLFLTEQSNSLWGEAGYDFQYDIRRDASRIALDANKNPIIGINGQPVVLDKTLVDHSTRLFLGYRRGFNKEVTLTTGLEYLQSVVDSERSRLNFDALIAAKIGGGLALGVGFTARYDNAPLPGKKELDTATTLSLIYAFSDLPAKAPPPCTDPATLAPVTPVDPPPSPKPLLADPPPATGPTPPELDPTVPSTKKPTP